MFNILVCNSIRERISEDDCAFKVYLHMQLNKMILINMYLNDVLIILYKETFKLDRFQLNRYQLKSKQIIFYSEIRCNI